MLLMQHTIKTFQKNKNKFWKKKMVPIQEKGTIINLFWL